MAVLPPIVSARRAAREVPPLRAVTIGRALAMTAAVAVIALGTIDRPAVTAAAAVHGAVAALVR